MNTEIISSYSLWYSVPCLIVGALFALLLYIKDSKFLSVGSGWIRLMFFLRFALVSILCMLFLNPLIKSIKQEYVQPKVVLAIDASQSILNDSLINDSIYVKNLSRNIELNLDEKFKFEVVRFGKEVKRGLDIEEYTPVSNVMNLKNFIDVKWGGDNVGALILGSDGVFNKGKPLEYVFDKRYPIYTFGLGDTNVYPDIAVSEVFYNRLAYFGNEYPLEIQIQAKEMSGESSRLKVFKNDTLQLDTLLKISNSRELIKIKKYLKATKTGTEEIKILLDSELKEKNIQNNSRSFLIEVIDKRQKVLIVSTAPHPDEAFFIEAITNNLNYEIVKKSFEISSEEIDFYNIIILSGIPRSFKAYTNFFNQCLKKGKNLLLLPHNNEMVNQFSQLQIGFNVESFRKSINEISAKYNPNFDFFDMNQDFAKLVEEVVPLKAPFGAYSFTNGQSMFNQKIGQISTKLPLVQIVNKGVNKIGVFLGEGYWRWRLRSYRITNSNDNWKEFVVKSLRLLSVKEERNQFQVDHKLVYNENEDVRIKAELYNESYESINQPEVSLKLTKNGKNFDYLFSRNDKSYSLNLGNLTPGKYGFIARVELNGKNLEAKGKFNVNQVNLEMADLVANHESLRRLSLETGGSFATKQNIENIVKEINANQEIKTLIYSHKELEQLLNQKWIFIVLVSLVSIEWFFRKYQGSF